MIHKIHVNQHVIRKNSKTGERNLVLSVKTWKNNTYANEVEILDAYGAVVATVLYRPDDPLPCGAKVWIEAEHVRIPDEI